MVYMITYDLHKEGQDYDNLINAIKSLGECCSYWKSSWLVKTSIASADDVCDKIDPFIDGNDRIIVIEVTKNMQGIQEKEQWECIKSLFR